MDKLKNFYQNIDEARMRLDNSIVLYDGEPYVVLCIADHKKDGIFRIYLDLMDQKKGVAHARLKIPYRYYDTPEGAGSVGPQMDKWLETKEGKESGVIRKQLNSPAFNKFRPFPLGMVNADGGVLYTERQPIRNMQQGLTNAMIVCHSLEIDHKNKRRPEGGSFHYFSAPCFAETIKRKYPSLDDCRKNLLDKEVLNTGAAFHTHFALMKGPLDLLVVYYKSDAVGYLVEDSSTEFTLKLGKRFNYLKEVIDNLKVFTDVFTG